MVNNNIDCSVKKWMCKIAMLLLMVGYGACAQGQNLQFGKTKLIDSKTDTVPKGKIWKIESFVYSKTLADCPGSGATVNISDSIVLNGNKLSVRAQRFAGLVDWRNWNTSPSPEFLVWEQKTPMWLPAGTTLSAGRGVLYISILEFNDVP
ncbi:MAG: hypothetical protein RIT07_1436 [Bacteroidota bacterium]